MKLWIRQGKNAEQFMNHINATGVVTIKSQATCDRNARTEMVTTLKLMASKGN